MGAGLTRRTLLFAIIQAAGWPIYFLLAVSIIAVALIIERFIILRKAGSAVAHELERFLTTLGTIATISPLMGLFGTVVGMIEIFGSQSPSGSNPQQLAHGISVALYNTGFGLVIAIPAMIFFRHFRGRVETFVIEMEQQAARLVDVVHGERFDFQQPPHAEA